jgi:hypothetical protein
VIEKKMAAIVSNLPNPPACRAIVYNPIFYARRHNIKSDLCGSGYGSKSNNPQFGDCSAGYLQL